MGFAGGEIPKLSANLLLLKGCAAIGVYWGRFIGSEPEGNRRDLQALFAGLQAGSLRPLIAATYPLRHGAQALAALLDRRVSGKLVILPGG